ncbi:uncharacterized protein N7477_002152 [Penicillium maclennaniae]|uniref:uncharacterized protein n=1 Tax=Penicillium maclennaniae TaxID=1343394 RepID=UPI0025411DB6|nr:uncharacterized protein N7477_002152 [Penicillium maclennaniae]KAJ5676519.1 hypothetical protein N7477_002152 [Penicillium maclennaniae]
MWSVCDKKWRTSLLPGRDRFQSGAGQLSQTATPGTAGRKPILALSPDGAPLLITASGILLAGEAEQPVGVDT